MTPEEGFVPIQSFRVCFDLERRIHKIDRWRIPLPYGLPVRSIAYFAILLALVVVVQRLPVIGAVLGAVHPSLRFVAVPAGVAYALTSWKIDGRLPHKAGFALLRMRAGPARVASFRPAPALGPVRLGAVTLAPDECSARLRRGVVDGPAAIVLRHRARLSARRRTLYVKQVGDQPLWRGKQIVLQPGQRMVIR